MSRRFLLPLALIAVATSLAACGDDPDTDRDDAGGSGPAAVADLDTACPQEPTHLIESPRDDVVRVGDELYAVANPGIVRMYSEEAGSEDLDRQAEVYDDPDSRLELLTAFDGDLVVLADVAGSDRTPRMFRITTEGEVVWEVDLPEGESVSLEEPDAVAEVGNDRYVDLRSGKDVEYSPQAPGRQVLSRDGRDYFLSDRGDGVLLYETFDQHVLLASDEDQETIKELPGSAAVCGDRLYALDVDLTTLTTYRIDGADLEQVAQVDLPEPATQAAFATTDGAVRLEVDGIAWLVTD